jgi:hypothetical protein
MAAIITNGRNSLSDALAVDDAKLAVSYGPFCELKSSPGSRDDGSHGACGR